ncbi:hypothetical protein [Alkalicoccus luteus]|uniref:Uncharacterized protein n=1 Tax=Alkalicoccus luteus TaxID=1237094 RepID=A0A969PTC7_9BACI|nr:hypothetical protein [Alkalicoccus luteus]NJP38968.1 hypothetical protein [Alkalicoccus luteus]
MGTIQTQPPEQFAKVIRSLERKGLHDFSYTEDGGEPAIYLHCRHSQKNKRCVINILEDMDNPEKFEWLNDRLDEELTGLSLRQITNKIRPYINL